MSEGEGGREALEAAIGHRFEQLGLLDTALTHTSFVNEAAVALEDNERLEFLGDAVLELVISEHLYRELPEVPEGTLTQLRARLVNKKTLAMVARSVDLGSHLRLGRGEERSGGRQRPSVLADGLEAVFGAVYLDGGLPAARAVILGLLGPHVDPSGPRKDAKSRLQEWAQRHHRLTPTYRIVDSHGPDHAVRFVAEVAVGTLLTARGEGRSKQEAQRRAADAALASVDAG